MYNRRSPRLGSYRLPREECKAMDNIYLILGSILAVTIYISYRMAGRQQAALAVEKRALPPRIIIFALGLITSLSFMVAIISVILVLLVPFLNISFAGTAENTTTVLFFIVFAGMAAGLGSYWLFVRLGFFSWKAFSLD